MEMYSVKADHAFALNVSSAFSCSLRRLVFLLVVAVANPQSDLPNPQSPSFQTGADPRVELPDIHKSPLLSNLHHLKSSSVLV